MEKPLRRSIHRIEETPLFVITTIIKVRHLPMWPNERSVHKWFKTKCGKRGYTATHFDWNYAERKEARELPLCARCRRAS